MRRERPSSFPRMWWRDGVLYQVYPRSFQDSDGDGVGDLPGVIERLDHLEWLGVSGIWLNPTFPSPNADWGFDVSDYRGVHPDFGTLEDLDRLVNEAGRRGIRILLDLVPNHTSDRHPWFEESRASRDSPRRDWYVWADPAPDGGPPNNWPSTFGGPAWTFDERTGQYYLHNFAPRQPDLNWWNEDVRREFDDILRWWFRRGIAGFRIDVAHAIVKDRELRDNPPAGPADAEHERQSGQRQEFSMNRPEVHDVLRRWRTLADAEHPPRVLIGETWVLDLERMASFYGQDDELHLAFNFPFLFAPFEAAPLSEVVEATERVVPPESWPVWTLSNHDMSRFPTRWCGGESARARVALMLLFTVRGTPVLYYGDEIAMPDTPAASGSGRDIQQLPVRPPRDPARTPMHWSADPRGGFSEGGAEPWLPLGDYEAANVAGQRADPGSPLHLTRDLIALRRANEDLRSGAYRPLDAPPGAWAFRRGERLAVALNLSGHPVTLPDLDGRVVVGTDRARDGHGAGGALELAPWEGVVLETGA
jgi:alpha-glucosidase